MSTATIHSELLERLPEVDDGFLEQNRDVLLSALGQVPGVDSVRAVVVWLLPRLVTEPLQFEAYLQAAARALASYPESVAAGDPVALMARHPAWVGLAHLEVSQALGGDPEDALAVAIQHARLGFSAASGEDASEGEVLWAMAETADEAGWAERSLQLLSRASSADFADPSARAKVQLLHGQQILFASPEDAASLLESVVQAEVSHDLRVQAAYLLGHLAGLQSRTDDAVSWLERALSLVEVDDDPSVSERLSAELARLVAEGTSPG